MRASTATMAFVFVFGLLIFSNSYAQDRMGWKGSGGWGAGAHYNRLYDPKTVETLPGEVVSIDHIKPMKGMSYGVHLMLKTAKGTMSVHLGPGWYIENQDVKLTEKDTIEVKGSLVTFEGKPAIIAAEVKKGEEVLKLRDENGYPVWAGWKKRSNP